MKTLKRIPLPAVEAALAGLVSAGVLLGVAQLVGAWFRALASPLVALGAAFIDFTPVWLKNFAVDTFGTADKLVLFISMGVVMAVLACLVGVLAWKRWVWGALAVVLLGVVMAAAVITRAGAVPADLIPTAVGVLAGLISLRLLVNRIPAPAVAAVPVNMTAAVPAGAAPPNVPAQEPPTATDPSRRSFFATAGLLAAAAVLAGAAGSALAGARRTVEEARRLMRLPAAAKKAPPLPAGVQSTAQGVGPYITPNQDFYRIDTALAVPMLDPKTWQLRVHGMVEREFTMNFQDLLDAELIESYTTLTCVSNVVGGSLAGNAKWLGYPLKNVLSRARPLPGADMVLSTSSDGFTASTPLEVLQDGRNALLAIGMNGEPLPLEHGFPVRMVVPGLYGFVSATKWVTDLEVTRFADKTAYWTDRGWSAKGPVKTASRIEAPRAFAQLQPGMVAVGGTAWAQHRGIDRVQVQVDDGAWQDAVLAAEASVDSWRQWSYRWQAEPGTHTLRVRAWDKVNGLQTEQRADPIPDGATGWHSVQVTVQG
ncbi:molybdopterin-dependent oxidoreductase [Arthrobacter sp. I2-34]|uniref:Molybdopterin-dependent oxidoreductase n=1 Tax=Arthrobacter hankyongi TaxID=2904801 RepID=A0ABS9L2F6_9MICC|nr:molybdopterin-dependent oxidoreductase [Arthrobacter hankyongi]MCG2620854.1 molybdopterin-dependent oxidoreductase [Arthrobacter hankyongi]